MRNPRSPRQPCGAHVVRDHTDSFLSFLSFPINNSLTKPSTYRSHADITQLSEDDLNEELHKLEIALKKILGVKPKLFRPPFGNYDDAALSVLANRGYSSGSISNYIA